VRRSMLVDTTNGGHGRRNTKSDQNDKRLRHACSNLVSEGNSRPPDPPGGKGSRP
jgi:hypothetical protein